MSAVELCPGAMDMGAWSTDAAALSRVAAELLLLVDRDHPLPWDYVQPDPAGVRCGADAAK